MISIISAGSAIPLASFSTGEPELKLIINYLDNLLKLETEMKILRLAAI